jgi:hypothetical protein
MEGSLCRPSGYPAAYLLILRKSDIRFKFKRRSSTTSIHELPRETVWRIAGDFVEGGFWQYKTAK